MQEQCKRCQRLLADETTGARGCRIQTEIDPDFKPAYHKGSGLLWPKRNIELFKNAVSFWLGKTPVCHAFKGKPEKVSLVKEIK